MRTMYIRQQPIMRLRRPVREAGRGGVMKMGVPAKRGNLMMFKRRKLN